MEDKNKEVQFTDEEIEEVSGGVAGATIVGFYEASNPKKGITEEKMKEACILKPL